MAWIKTISPEEASGTLSKIYEKAAAFAGHLLNLYQVQSLNPAVLKTSENLYETLMSGPSSLSLIEREMIAIVVARVLNCTSLANVHGERLRQLTQDDRLVRLMKLDYRMLVLENRPRALLDFAVKVTQDVHSIVQETVQDLRSNGLTDEDILNGAQLAAFFNYYARLVLSLGAEPESLERHPEASKLVVKHS